MATLAPVIPFPPHPAPSPGSIAIAEGILDAGCGPEEIPYLVGDFEQAGPLSREVVTVMASLAGAPSVEAYLAWTGCAAIWAAAGPS